MSLQQFQGFHLSIQGQGNCSGRDNDGGIVAFFPRHEPNATDFVSVVIPIPLPEFIGDHGPHDAVGEPEVSNWLHEIRFKRSVSPDSAGIILFL